MLLNAYVIQEMAPCPHGTGSPCVPSKVTVRMVVFACHRREETEAQKRLHAPSLPRSRSLQPWDFLSSGTSGTYNCFISLDLKTGELNPGAEFPTFVQVAAGRANQSPAAAVQDLHF